MKAIIIGAGFTGVQLAKKLIAEGNNVVLVDKDPEKVRHSRNQLDCSVIEADGNSLEVLDDAGIDSANALIALTEDDELNMITCSLVDAAYPDVLKIARVRNYAYYMNAISDAKAQSGHKASRSRPLFGIDHMLHPDVEAAAAVHRAMTYGAVGNVIGIGEAFSIVSVTVGAESRLVGKTLREIAALPEWRYIVAYVETESGAVLPCGETVIEEDSRIGVLFANSDAPELEHVFNNAVIAPFGRIAVFGAGRIGSLVLEHLIGGESSASLFRRIFGSSRSPEHEVVMLDGDEAMCRSVAERFDMVRVLCGDATDGELIEEENLGSCDLMVAVSENFDRNLVTAAYLKSRGVRKTIALAASSDFDDIAGKLGIDVAVPLQDTVVDCIMSKLRGSNVKAVHSVCNRMFEIVEFGISSKSAVAGKTLKDVARPGEFLVLLIRPAGAESFVMPHGDTVFGEGDRVVAVVRSGDVSVIKMFAGME